MADHQGKSNNFESRKNEIFSQTIKELSYIVDKQKQEAILALLKELENVHVEEKGYHIIDFNNASCALTQLWQLTRGFGLLNHVTKSPPSCAEGVNKRLKNLWMLANQVSVIIQSTGALTLGECVHGRDDHKFTFVKNRVIDTFETVNLLFAEIYYSVKEKTDLNMVNVIEFMCKMSRTKYFDDKFSPKEFVTLAVDSGANVNMKTKYDWKTPLSKCIGINSMFREATIESLLSHGADMFQCCYSSNSASNNFPAYLLHFTTFRLEEATTILEMYQRFYHMPQSFFNDHLPNGSSLVQSFLRCAVNELDTSGFKRYDLESKDKLIYLLSKGADLSNGEWDEPPVLIVASHADNLGMSCLDVCALGASSAERGWFGRSILHIVSDVATVETLCKDYSAKVLLDAVDFFGRTPLMHAVMRSNCQCNRPSKLEYFTKNLRDLCDCTTLCVEHLKALIDLGADWKLVDQDGVSVIHLAAMSHPDIMKSIFSHCMPTPEDISIMLDKNGASPLHYAVFANNLHCVNLLLDFGVDFNAIDDCGNTPHDIATFFGYHQITQVLQAKSPLNLISDNRTDILQVGSCLKTQIVDVYDENTTSISGLMLDLNNSMTEDMYDSILNSPFLGCKRLDEAKEIQAEITSLVMNISQKVESIQHDFAFNVHLRGSSAEQTKAGLPDEFDFNLIMKNIDDPTNFHEERSVDYPVIVVSPYILKNLNLYSNKSSFHRCFIVTVLKVLNNQQFWTDSMLKMGGLRMGKVGAVLTLYWNGAVYKHLKISVDLVPSFPIKDHPFIPLQFPIPVDFSGCELYHTQDKYGKLAISYSDMEAVLMKLLPDSAIEAYKISKAIRSVYVSRVFSYHDEFERYILPVDGFTSYYLKNLLMWEFNHAARKGTDIACIKRGEWIQRIFLMWRGNMRMNSVCGEESFELRY